MADQNERLFQIALKNAKTAIGGTVAFDLMGEAIRAALVLAEVTKIIANQDSDAAGPAMKRFADYAVARAAEVVR